LKKACLRKRKKGKKNQPKKIGKKRTGKYTETMIIRVFPCLIVHAKIAKNAVSRVVSQYFSSLVYALANS
jgi:hypothetical protein